MKDNEFSNVEFRICHIFKYPIDKVWDVISDLVLLSDTETKIGHVEDMKGDGTNKLNSEFYYVWYGYYKSFLKTIELSEQNNKKKIKWHGKTDAINIEYEFGYTLYANTSDNSTLLVWEYFPTKTSDDSEKFINGLETLKTQVISRWELLLSKHTKDVCHYESIIIKSSLKEIFKLISDWKKLCKVAPLIADSVEYIGDPLTIGTKLKLNFINKKLKCYLKITQIEESDNSMKLHLECYDGKPKVPPQDIHFDIEKINEDICIIKFKHLFKQDLKYEFINSISHDKRIILKLLKQYLEKVNVENL